ncbi:MAG: hypothetical protein R6X20_02580 [Phycisphaerae bacterium]
MASEQSREEGRQEGGSRRFRWRSLVFNAVVSAVVAAVVATFFNWLDLGTRSREDLRAHLVSFDMPIGDVVRFEVEFVNTGNRKATVAEIVPGVSFERGGAIFPGAGNCEVIPPRFTIDPGDIQKVSVELRADTDRLYHNAGAAARLFSGVEPRPGEREVQLALGIRARDYHGVGYKGLWKFATLRLTSDRIVSWCSAQESIRLFGSEFRASPEGWDLLPFSPRWDNAANKPERQGNGESRGTER